MSAPRGSAAPTCGLGRRRAVERARRAPDPGQRRRRVRARSARKAQQRARTMKEKGSSGRALIVVLITPSTAFWMPWASRYCWVACWAGAGGEGA